MGNVLITGATSGIGYALAQVFAKEGYDLILVGRDEEKLKRTKMSLEATSKVHTIVSDLSTKEAATMIYKQVKEKGLRVDILVNNAGAGIVGEFCEYSLEKDLELIQLNMVSLTLLTKYFAKEMKERGSGKILNVASTGAYHPGPYTGLYYATKAYVLSLSEALYSELKPYHVRVSSLCPGATKTAFAKAAGRENASFAMTASFVAEKAYKGLIKGKRTIVPGMLNKLFIKLPRPLGAYFIGRYQNSLKN